jgi:hypothetical protein
MLNCTPTGHGWKRGSQLMPNTVPVSKWMSPVWFR